MCFRRTFWSQRLLIYLATKPRIRAQLRFETDRPLGSQSGIWSYYDHWPSEWKARLLDFCVAYDRGTPLPMEDPLPLADPTATVYQSRLGYRSVELARDIYLAQVALVLFLDMTSGVPWRLDDWSDNELKYLLSSHVCFSAYRNPSNELYYVVDVGSRSETTENILSDPRIAHKFLLSEPEQGKRLLGASPSETGQKLSGWFHDYLFHHPADWSPNDFHRSHPLLKDRLIRHEVKPIGNRYVTTWGCGSASSLFADLMRAVNIPVRKVTNVIDSF